MNRGSITFWLDDEAIQAWYESATPSSRGRPQRYSDLAITTVLVIKRVFRLTLRAAQGFIGVRLENGIYGHSRFCNTDFDDKLACLNLSGV
ncbi:TPA: transposase [Citrobacter amalonaticus]|nr:transposase [Citrobacter amalonaticus]